MAEPLFTSQETDALLLRERMGKLSDEEADAMSHLRRMGTMPPPTVTEAMAKKSGFLPQSAAEWERFGLEAGLSMVGGAAAGALAGPPGAAVGAAGGATTGVLRALGVRALGAGIGAAAGSLVAEPLDPSEEPLKRAGITGGTGAAGEALGVVGNRVLFGGVFRGSITPEGKHALALGLRGTPAQLTRSRALDIMENVAEASLLGGGKIGAARQESVDAAFALVKEFHATFPKAGELATESYTRLLYRLIPDFGVDITAVKKLAAEVAAQSGQISPGARQLTNIILDLGGSIDTTGLSPSAQKFLSAQGLNTIPFEQAQRLRSHFLGVSRQITSELKPHEASSAARRLAGALDDAIEAGATAKSPEALIRWRTANEFVKQTKAGSYIEEAFLRPATQSDGSLSGKLIAGRLARANPEVLASHLSPQQIQQFKLVAAALETFQSKAGKEGTGKIFIQLAQMGAVGYMASGTHLGYAGAVLVIPKVLSMLSTNSVTARLLVDGLENYGTREGTAALAKLSLLMTSYQTRAATRKQEVGGSPAYTYGPGELLPGSTLGR